MSQAAYLAPIVNGQQFFTNAGIPLVGGYIYFFQAGTSTPQAAYTDYTATTSLGTSIQLDSAGRVPQEIWLKAGQPYKFTFSTSALVPVGYTLDNVSGINDPGSSSVSTAEWTASGLTPTYISSTQFSVTGNQTALFPTGQRVKYAVSAGTGYGTVSTSAYGTVTTVTIVPDGTVLDAGLSAVAYGFLNASSPSEDALGVKYTASITPPAGTVAAALQSVGYTGKLWTTAGSGSAFTLTLSPAPTALNQATAFLVQFSFTPSGTPTLNVNGLGALSLVQINSSGASVAASIVGNEIAEVTYNGSAYVVLAQASPGRLLKTTYFLTSGTWTAQSGTNTVEVEVLGGGGGAPSSGVGYGGGGAGGYCRKTLGSGVWTSPQTCTVGAGGVNAAAGGTSNFGTFCNATGGGYGTSLQGGIGGIGSSGDLNISGGGGGPGGAFSADYLFGQGGNSYFGGGAPGALTNSTVAGSSAVANTGGGAAGGNSSGGTGGSGLICVREYS